MNVAGRHEDPLFRAHPSAIRFGQAMATRSFGPVANAFAPKMPPRLRIVEFCYGWPEQQGDNLPTRVATQLPLRLGLGKQAIRLAGVVLATGHGFLIVANPTLSEHMEPCRSAHIAAACAGDLLVRSLVKFGLPPNLQFSLNRFTNDFRLVSEENDNLLDQLTDIPAHEFSNLLSIIQFDCDRPLVFGAKEPRGARIIGLVSGPAMQGGSVSKWLGAFSGTGALSHRQQLDDFLGADLNLLETVCRPDMAVSSQLQTNDASPDVPERGLPTCLLDLVRRAATPDKREMRAAISIMLTKAPDGGRQMARAQIRIGTDRAINCEVLVTSKHPQFTGHHKAHASIGEFTHSVGGAAHHEFVGRNTASTALLTPRVHGAELLPDAVVEAIDGASESRRHLVVVEDDPAALEALVELLEYEGFPITACGNAEQALAALAVQPDAVLVTDIVLPTIDGLALAKAAILANPLLKVVIMSGHIPDKEHSDPRWAFLQKPLDIDQLVAAIMQADE